MKRTMIKDLSEEIGKTVKIQGWLQALRDQKQMQFLIIRDASGLVQVINTKGDDLQRSAAISQITQESALTISGRVVHNPIVKLGGLELELQTLVVEAKAEQPLPLDPVAETLPSIDYRMDWRFLDLRRHQNLLLFQVATRVEQAMREYWVSHDFIEIHTPKLMGSPSESGAELFELPYFGKKAYLAQSPQFYKQMAMAAGFEKVFEIGPAFRADPSFTSRHMTEFTSVDMEMSWIGSHEEVMAFLEEWICHIYEQLKVYFGKEILADYGVELIPPQLPFPRVTMQAALAILKAQGYTPPPEKKGDIDPAGERLLAQYISEKYQHDFFFLTDWPVSARPFYHMRSPEDPAITRSFDLIAKGLEIATGAQREHHCEVLKQQAQEKGLSLGPIEFYLDFFRFGCPPHGGFGFGLGRFLMILLGIQNIRETVYLFRGPTRLTP